VGQGSYLDARCVDSNEFICNADCRFPVLLILLLSLNRAYCVTASNIVVVLC
jgi:hypothetical protein